MIQKIIKLKNIGNFHDFNAAGDVIFRELTLIYGDNGRGKTTLASLFRSLSMNDPHSLLERRTTGSTTPIIARVLTDNGPINFSEANCWDSIWCRR